MTKTEFAEVSGVSISFLSDLTNGKANPSLKIMESIAKTLQVPLTLLLESTDLDYQTLDDILGSPNRTLGLPSGYERVTAVLPEHQAFIVKKWSMAAQNKIRSSTDKK